MCALSLPLKPVVLALATCLPFFAQQAMAAKENIVNPKLVLATALDSTTSTALDANKKSDELIQEAMSLLQKGDTKASYHLLAPLEVAYAGDVSFDYLLGMSGVESGNVTQGAFALERVLAQDPNNNDARAEMAKAYYLLGEIENSKTEFNQVLQKNPDEKTKKTIEGLLSAIKKLDGSAPTFAAYLDVGLGWDSNVSSAPDLTAVSVPLFGGAVLSLGNTGKSQSDGLLNVAGGASFRYPINEKMALFGSLGLNNRANSSQSEFDTAGLDLNGGVDYHPNEENNFSLGLQNSNFFLDGKSYRHAIGGSLQWIHNFDTFNQAGLYGQYSRIDYKSQSTRDADRAIVGINAAHAFQVNYNPVIFGTIYGGKEEVRDSSFDNLSQDIVGLRAGGQLSFGSDWQGFVSLAYEMRNHDAIDVAFLKEREDKQYDASLGLRYTPANDWTIKPQISYTKNDSNISLYGFDRTLISVNIRKDFNW